VTIEFRVLKSEYHKQGMTQRVVWREGAVAITSVHLPKTGQVAGYEVWIVQTGAAREVGGVVVPAGEFPPSAASWGRCGWSYKSIAEACVKAKSLQIAVDSGAGGV